MFFNGFTLMLCIFSFAIGMWVGIRAEQAHQRNMRERWINGETIEEQMAREVGRYEFRSRRIYNSARAADNVLPTFPHWLNSI